MKWNVKTLTVVICLCFISYLVGFNSTSNTVKFVKLKYPLAQKQNEEHGPEQPKEETKEETKDEPKDEPKVEPKQELEEETKEEPKEKPKQELKEETKEEPKEQPKQELKEETKEETNEETNEKSKEQPKESVENQPPQKHVPRTILFWYKPWGDARDMVLSEECGKCHLTTDQSLINSPSTGAVVFHYNELSLNTMPTERNPDQYYIYLTMESPALVLRASHRDLHEYDGVFNWTMTYRRDSDIYSPYNTMANVMQSIKNNNKHTDDAGISLTMKRKKRGVVWIVSNCGLTNGAKDRLKLVEQMVQAGMDIDRRGNCFPDNPSPPGLRANRLNGEQIRFMEEAKFYIAFENAHHCKDYITEKLYDNAFLVGTVPIVWGAKKEDYEAVVPPHSCIFVDDFAGNYTKLADYIKYLDTNDTAYEEYLHWRKMDVKDMFGYGKTTRDCQLCQMISGMGTSNDGHQAFNVSSSRKVIKSLKDWAYGDEDEECLK